MKLSYEKLLCPIPIKLSIGSVRNHKLIEIADILGFEQFNLYEMFLKMTPKIYYTKFKGDDGNKFWNDLSDEHKKDINMFSVVLEDESLQNLYLDIFNFFFVERVYFKDGIFVILKDGYEMTDELSLDDICGAIFEDNFSQVLYILQQVCCIDSDEDRDETPPKFKNKLAEKMYEKMKNAEREQKEQESKKNAVDMCIPNIISKVSNNHPSINPINVWGLTLFQLLDSFRCIQFTKAYGINSIRCAVWGDEENKFDAALWYHNQYDKDNSVE